MDKKSNKRKGFTLAEGGRSPLLYGDEGVAEGYSCVETKGHKFHHTSQSSSPRLVKKGFTLAEVLITLGVIGVVAAVTMPTLIANHREKATVAKLKKSYSILNQAYMRAINEHGEIQDWGFAGSSSFVTDSETGEKIYNEESISNSKLLFDVLTEYMPNVKKCYQPSCDVSYYQPKTLSGIDVNKGAFYSIVDLEDGISLVGGWINLEGCKNLGLCGDFGIDTNGGKKPPNTYGIDIFQVRLTTKGIVAIGFPTDHSYKFPSYCKKAESAISTTQGYACTAWVIQNENMDYLHCDDLSWSGKHKCK